MSTVDTTSGMVMDKAASLNNDTARTVYTYPVQIPYLNMALQELQEYFELNNAPVTNVTSAEIDILANQTVVAFGATPPLPSLPSDLIDIQQLWERIGDGQPYTPMTRVNFLPHYLDGALTANFIVWAWLKNEIHVLPSSQDNQIKLDYIRTLFAPVTDEEDELAVINCESFLQFRTAALLARFIGEDIPRADRLDGNAGLALDRTLGINSKGQQPIMTRRRPFRAAYKNRSSNY